MSFRSPFPPPPPKELVSSSGPKLTSGLGTPLALQDAFNRSGKRAASRNGKVSFNGNAPFRARKRECLGLEEMNWGGPLDDLSAHEESFEGGQVGETPSLATDRFLSGQVHCPGSIGIQGAQPCPQPYNAGQKHVSALSSRSLSCAALQRAAMEVGATLRRAGIWQGAGVGQVQAQRSPTPGEKRARAQLKFVKTREWKSSASW